MKFHASVKYPDYGSHFWWNHSKENIIDKVVVPFINGQIVTVKNNSNKRLLNMRNVTFLTIYSTAKSLKEKDGLSIIEQIQEPIAKC